MIIKRLLVLTSVVSPTQKNAGDTDLPFLTNGMLTKTNISKESKTINWGNKLWTCITDSNIYQVFIWYPLINTISGSILFRGTQHLY